VDTSEEWRNFVEDLKKQWRILWRDRIDDKLRAEGIANRDYSLLFMDRGTVIIATRDYKPPDFVEILERHKPADVQNVAPPNPAIGGWGKFVRTVLSKQKRFIRRRRLAQLELDREKKQQLKKGGRGWLHFRMHQM